MMRSEKILKKNNISREVSDSERIAIENNVLIKHIIDNDIRHIWAFIKAFIVAFLGLFLKLILDSFNGG